MKTCLFILLSMVVFQAHAETTMRFSAPATITDESFTDWAGSIFQARVDFMTPTTVKVQGEVYFSYRPKAGVTAVAIKHSSGGDDLNVSGAVTDFTDLEGRRILGFNPGDTLNFMIPVIIANPGTRTVEVSVELEPVEFSN